MVGRKTHSAFAVRLFVRFGSADLRRLWRHTWPMLCSCSRIAHRHEDFVEQRMHYDPPGATHCEQNPCLVNRFGCHAHLLGDASAFIVSASENIPTSDNFSGGGAIVFMHSPIVTRQRLFVILDKVAVCQDRICTERNCYRSEVLAQQ
jgi:hypothetical protein